VKICRAKRAAMNNVVVAAKRRFHGGTSKRAVPGAPSRGPYDVTTCVGTCVRITKVAQYSSIRWPALLWAPARSPFSRAPARALVPPLVGPAARSPFPISQISPLRVSSSRYLLRSLARSSPSLHIAAVQISQPDFILVSRDILYSAGPRASPCVAVPPARLRTRAIRYEANSVHAQKYKEGGEGAQQVRPRVRGLTYWTVYTPRAVLMLRPAKTYSRRPSIM